MSEPPVHVALAVVRGLRSLIRAHQRAHDLSIRDIATAADVPRSALGAYLNGSEIKLETLVKLLTWLDSSTPVPPPDGLTRAARAALDAMVSAHGYGQAWLRVEPRAYGLCVPDGVGTLNELTRVRGVSWATWGELESAGLVRRGLPAIAPPARGPRNRNRRNEGWPVEIITAPREAASVMLTTTTEETAP